VIHIFLIFLRLGCLAFGGPVAHLAIFQDEFVARRRWLRETTYTELLALCQLLPGPASSQVGFAVGIHRGGLAGGFAAWLGFTLPSAVVMAAAAYGLSFTGWLEYEGLMIGLKASAAAVVAHAIWQLGRKLCPGIEHLILALAAMGVVLLIPSAWVQAAVILLGGLYGALRFRLPDDAGKETILIGRWPLTRLHGTLALGLFAVLLLGLPLLTMVAKEPLLQLTDAMFRSGSLVFGGGHVVLPLLEEEVVAPGWVQPENFLAGYGLAQAVPGPLFSFSAFLGGSLNEGFWAGSPWVGAVLALVAIYVPAWLLVIGFIPFWENWAGIPWIRRALRGTNAVVVGLLLAAFYDPVCTEGLSTVGGIFLGVLGLILLAAMRWPAWLVVLTVGVTGTFFFHAV